MKLFSTFFSIFLLALLLVPNYINAAPSNTVSPLIIDTDAEARDIISKEITITNTGTQQMTVYPTVNNVSLEEGGTIEEFLTPVESDRTTSIASWIEISRRGIDLPVGESHTIPLTLRINHNPKPGTYHAFVGFGFGRNHEQAVKQVKDGKAQGTIVTINIEDKKIEALRLSKFIIDKFVTSSNNEAAVFSFKNPGDETLVPKGEIIFYNSRGSEVGSVEINDENTTISPGGEHVFKTTVPSEGLFGKYKAFLSIEYGNKQRASIQDTSFFYVLPFKAILSILVLILLLTALGAWYIHKKYFDEDIDDSTRLTFHMKDSHSDAKDHDINLKQKDE